MPNIKDQKQESLAIANKPARREITTKLLQFDVFTTLSLTILVYLHSCRCCCVRNLRNPEWVKRPGTNWQRGEKAINLEITTSLHHVPPYLSVKSFTP